MIRELSRDQELLEALIFGALVSELGDPFTVPAGCEDLGFVYPASSLPEELPGVQELKDQLTSSIVDRYGTGSWELIEQQKELADTLYRLQREAAPAEAAVEVKKLAATRARGKKGPKAGAGAAN